MVYLVCIYSNMSLKFSVSPSVNHLTSFVCKLQIIMLACFLSCYVTKVQKFLEECSALPLPIGRGRYQCRLLTKVTSVQNSVGGHKQVNLKVYCDREV